MTEINHTSQRTQLATEARRQHWDENYQNGFKPWDTGIVPPEVVGFWHSGLLTPTGRALDMGCGTGTNVRYLRSIGLIAVGIELSLIALGIARSRGSASIPMNTRNDRYVLADTTALPLQNLNASYILDIGCLHTIPRDLRPAYATGILENLIAGGYYHLYAHGPLAPDHPRYSDDSGLEPQDVVQLFSPELSLLTTTQGELDHGRKSHWFLLHKSI